MNKPTQIAWNSRLGAAENARRKLPEIVEAYFKDVREMLARNPAPAELHAVRLATKRLRYTLELFRPCYGRGLEQRIASLRQLQQILGEVNDCAAAERLIASDVPASEGRRRVETFLHRRAAAKAAALRRHWRDSFDAPGREHWWLDYLLKTTPVGEPKL